jgi:hypothetical protein
LSDIETTLSFKSRKSGINARQRARESMTLPGCEMVTADLVNDLTLGLRK